MIPKHADRPADPASHARCECQRLVYCPRHHATGYAHFEAKAPGQECGGGGMSAEVLRRAASLMRERAEGATPGPWFTRKADAIFNPSVATRPQHEAEDDPLDSSAWVAECGPRDENGPKDALHIASWHPAIALAVADWLDDEADEIPPGNIETKWGPIDNAPAVQVARLYLGESA